MSAQIVVIACNWNGWSCLEAAADAGRSYPASVKVIRVSCLSRIHTGLILKAFELGAEGVMLAGCEPGECQFGVDDEGITREFEKTRRILEMLGISEERLALVRLPAFDGQIATEITDFVRKIERLPARRPRKARLQAAQIT